MSNVPSPTETTGTRYVRDGSQSIQGGFARAKDAAGVPGGFNPAAADPSGNVVSQVSV